MYSLPYFLFLIPYSSWLRQAVRPGAVRPGTEIGLCLSLRLMYSFLIPYFYWLRQAVRPGTEIGLCLSLQYCIPFLIPYFLFLIPLFLILPDFVRRSDPRPCPTASFRRGQTGSRDHHLSFLAVNVFTSLFLIFTDFVRRSDPGRSDRVLRSSSVFHCG